MTPLTPRPSAKRSPGPIAVCRDQDTGAAELPDAPSHPPTLHSPADLGDQCHPRSHGRVWVVAALGRKGIEQLLAVVTDTDDQPRLQAHASPRSAPNCVGPKSRF